MLVLVLAPLLFVSGCLAQQQRLEDTRSELEKLRKQEQSLTQQAGDDGLAVSERNAVQTALDRTRALIENKEAEAEILEEEIERGFNQWMEVGGSIVLGALGIGGLAGRRAGQ